MIRQFIKFSLIGSLNTIVDFVIYFILTRFLHVHYIGANIIALIVALTISFFANKHFTFKDASPAYLNQYLKFLTINAVSFSINMVTLYIGVEILNIHDLLAKIGAIAITALFNFTAMKYWAFRSN